MCIIIHKPQGVDMPYGRLKTCFANNGDGAGFMYADGNYVMIEKGFMKLPELMAALWSLEKRINIKDTAMILHFRLATHGEKAAGNTHPFILCKNPQKLIALNIAGDTGVAHNGIILDLPRHKHLSDTMIFIKEVMADLSFKRLKQPAIQALIELATNSKWAIMHKSGQVLLYGGSWTIDDGCHYSNISYLQTISWYTFDNYNHRSKIETIEMYPIGMDCADLSTSYGHLDECNIDPITDIKHCHLCHEEHQEKGRLCYTCKEQIKDYEPELFEDELNDD